MHITGRLAWEQLRSILCRGEPPGFSRRAVRQIICQAAGIEYIHQLVLKPTRVLIAAAGKGSRFRNNSHDPVPKIVAQGAVGRPVLLRVLDVLAPFDPHPFVIVNRESGPIAIAAVKQDARHDPLWCVQEQPQGTGQAILSIEERLQGFQGDIIVVWGDMGALNERLVFAACAIHQSVSSAMTIPTKWEKHPYVTLVRGCEGTVVDVLQERRGEVLPAYGEQDCGVFFVRCPALFGWLHAIAQQQPAYGAANELDFLALIRHCAARNEQIYALDMGKVWDSQGVNTLHDLRRADTSYARIKRETEIDLHTARLLHTLTDVLSWSTMHPEMFVTLSYVLQRFAVEYETVLSMLPDGKREALERCRRGLTGKEQ